MDYKTFLNESCKDIQTARKFVSEVGKLAKKYDANYFIVTDGASGINNSGNPAVKNARECHIKWEKENGGDPYEDWGKNESYDELYNETLETSVTRPFLSKDVTLYHGSKIKYKNDVIDPRFGAINIGTKLSSPRYSSWWTTDKIFPLFSSAQTVLRKLLCKYIDNKEDFEKAYVLDFKNRKFYINQKYKDLIDWNFSSENYLYQVTVPRRIVGRGHNIEIDEYTLDQPIKADKVKLIKLKDLKPFIEFKDESFIILKIKEFESSHATYKPTVMDKMIYYSNDEMRKIRKDYRKKFGYLTDGEFKY